MKTIFIFIFISFSIYLSTNAANLDSLRIFNRLEKKNQNTINIKTSFSKDSNFDLTNLIKSKVEGFCISGKGNLFSDSSMIRILVVDENSQELLIYEASAVFNQIGKVNLKNSQEETFLNSPFYPVKLTIQIIDAEIEINKLTYYESSISNKQLITQKKIKIESEIADLKLKQVKSYIKRYNLFWSANNNNFSTRPYRYKKQILGEKVNSYGFEYYSNGFFSTPSSSLKNNSITSNIKKTLLKSATTYVDEFDWRDRHGTNWVTSNKCQSGCYFPNYIDCDYNAQDWNTDSIDCVNDGGDYRKVGTCWAFSAVGTIEAVTNLYFNQHINYDLSEQQVVSCAHGVAEPWYLASTLDYIRDNHVVTEECYPYIAENGDCGNVCANPSDQISFSNYSQLNTEAELKSNLISKGPLAAKMFDWSHVLVCVGWGTVKAGDQIEFYPDKYIQSGDPIIGMTYWMLKQSDTKSGWPNHTGYFYMIDMPPYAYAINTPISSNVYDSSDILCTDNDNDGYYWWGVGPKPSNCTCCSDEADGDDSNPNLGPMDAYGNCRVLTAPLNCLYEINGTETWTTTHDSYAGYLVKSGGNLTINGASVDVKSGCLFKVETGGIFTMNSGTIQ